MKTYGHYLRILEALRSITTYVAADGTKRTNNFGSETYNVARAIKKLEKVEEEFMTFRNDIIKQHNPDNHEVVDDQTRRAIENGYNVLVTTVVDDIVLQPISHESLFGNGNVVNADAIAALLDYITNSEDE